MNEDFMLPLEQTAEEEKAVLPVTKEEPFALLMEQERPSEDEVVLTEEAVQPTEDVREGEEDAGEYADSIADAAASEQSGREEERQMSEPLSETRMAELAANPMFAHFAHGRTGSLNTILRDFERMLSAGGRDRPSRMCASDAARVTPTAQIATADVALNERQRALARAAGMSYREYYDLASDIPGLNLFYKKENHK